MIATASQRLEAFRRDIAEEPATLERILDLYSSVASPLRLLPQAKRGPIVIIGMGSSFNAGHAAIWWLRRGGRPAWVQFSSEVDDDLAIEETILVAVSQSGKTVETLGAVEKFRAVGGRTVVGVTNVEDSLLASAADVVLPLLAGPEGGISAKSYVASVAVLTLLAGHYLGVRSLGTEVLPAAINGSKHALSAWAERGEDVIEPLLRSTAIHVVGSGASLSTALEGALILKEAPELPAEGTLTADFLHGAFHLINESFAGVLISGSPTGTRDAEFRERVKRGRGAVVSIGLATDSTSTYGLADAPLAARPMYEITPIELAAAAIWAKRLST